MNDKDCNTGPCDVTIDDPDVAVILKGALGDLQRAAERLGDNGIDCGIIRQGEAGPGCCSTTMCLVVAHEDVPAAHAVFDQDWRRGLSEQQIAALEAGAHIVLDPDAPETTCPACMTTFETGPKACPDCGLALG